MKMIWRAKQSGRQDQPLKTTFSIHMKNSASSHKNTPGNHSRGDRQYGWTGNSWLNWNAKKKCIGWGDRNRLTRRRTEALPWHAEVELRGPKLAWRLTVEGHVEGSTKDFYKYVKNKRWTMENIKLLLRDDWLKDKDYGKGWGTQCFLNLAFGDKVYRVHTATCLQQSWNKILSKAEKAQVRAYCNV